MKHDGRNTVRSRRASVVFPEFVGPERPKMKAFVAVWAMVGLGWVGLDWIGLDYLVLMAGGQLAWRGGSRLFLAFVIIGLCSTYY